MRVFSTPRPRLLWPAMVMFISGCLNSDDEIGSETNIEYKLATIQQGGYVSKDDPLLLRMGQALDRLESKCPDSRERLADMGLAGRDLLREKGIQEPLILIFENWGTSIPNGVTKGEVGRCGDILALYVTLRGSQ